MEVTLRPVVMTVLALDVLCLLLLLANAPWAARISLHWDFASFSAGQYVLQSRAYLTSSTIALALACKMPAGLIFLLALDTLATDVPGAMCAVGVLQAMPWGWGLLAVKVGLLYGLTFWLLVHRRDLKTPDWHHTPFKFNLFHLLLGLSVLEAVMEWAGFLALRTDRLVTCCGSLFQQPWVGYDTGLGLDGSTWLLVTLGASWVAMGLAAWRKQSSVSAAANLAFLVLALVALVDVFSPYVYELPHHRCPFCLLQAGAHYIGYPLYACLFYGTFRGMAAGAICLFLKENPHNGAWHALAANGLFLAMAGACPISYFLRHGVWM